MNGKRDIEDGGLQVWRKRDMQDSRGKAEDGLGEGQKVTWGWVVPGEEVVVGDERVERGERARELGERK